MRSIIMTTIVVGLMAGSCTREQISVKSNNDFQTENIENQTFTIVNDVNQPTSLLNETAIKEEVERQMEIRGYVSQDDNADVLISIAVYDKNLRLTEVNKVYVGVSEGKEKVDIHQNNLRNGTLVITMIDRNTQKVFWTGHASKIFGKYKSLKDRDLKNITRAIFDDYRVTANHFLAKNQ
jgi:archaellum component FlaG (FlaF/FlaG flagellin family)